jgi:aspartate carbamoyltransferase regulatory subunit
MNVEKITSGTVIDHIPAGVGMRVLGLLNIGAEYGGRVALVMNVPSKRTGKKDIVKIEGITVEPELANRIALIAPKATINIIAKEAVVRKYLAEPPDKFLGGACPNPNCITAIEPGNCEFTRTKDGYTCAYCERVFKSVEIV